MPSNGGVGAGTVNVLTNADPSHRTKPSCWPPRLILAARSSSKEAERPPVLRILERALRRTSNP